jgi:hypothetical protein
MAPQAQESTTILLEPPGADLGLESREYEPYFVPTAVVFSRARSCTGTTKKPHQRVTLQPSQWPSQEPGVECVEGPSDHEC